MALKVELVPDGVIRETVERLGNNPMTIFSHDFKSTNEKIIDSVLNNAKNYTYFSKLHPAIGLMDVVLAANRNYRKQVERHIQRMRWEFPNLTFAQLWEVLDRNDYESFKKIWGHRDQKNFLF